MHTIFRIVVDGGALSGIIEKKQRRKGMKTITFMTGLLTFYLKGQISTDQNFLKLKVPNTILALIPLGSKKHNIPVQQLASVSSNFELNFKRFIVGVIICLIAFGTFSDAVILAILLLLWGASTVITSFGIDLNVTTTAGVEYEVSFLVLEKSKVSQAEQLINDMIANRLNDTNNRQVAEAQTSAIVDAIKK